jgi:hypothetical protein
LELRAVEQAGMDEEIITKTYWESGTKFRDEHRFEIECADVNRSFIGVKEIYVVIDN